MGTFSLLERGGHHFKRDLGNGDGEERSLGRSGAAAAGKGSLASTPQSLKGSKQWVSRSRRGLAGGELCGPSPAGGPKSSRAPARSPAPPPRGVRRALSRGRRLRLPTPRTGRILQGRPLQLARRHFGYVTTCRCHTLTVCFFFDPRPGPAVQLVTFSYAKEWLSGELGDGGPGAAVLASLLSTLALVAVVNPLDALLLKMECQGQVRSSSRPPFLFFSFVYPTSAFQDAPFLRGHFAAAGTLFSTDGPSGFYRGCGTAGKRRPFSFVYSHVLPFGQVCSFCASYPTV